MTQVTLHGILAKEFRKTFSLAVKRPKEVFDAISCSHSNFRNRLVELANQGIHFTLLVDGKKMTTIEELSIASDHQKIDIVPLICGAGNDIIGGILIIVGTILSFVPGVGPAIGVPIAMAGLQMILAPAPPELMRPSADINSAKQSFLFSSKANIAEQGIPVPVGYGRLRVGSAVIQSTIKSYPQAFEKENALSSDGQAINNDKTF